MEIENLILNNKIINEIEKDQMNPILDIREKDKMNPINIFESKKPEMIDMLKKLFENTLESKICNLEKKTKNQLSIIKTTSTTTKYITDLTKQIQRKLNEKKLQSKRLKFSKSSKKMNPAKSLLNSKNSDVSKSPIRSVTNRGLFKSPNIKKNLLQRMRSDSKNKSPFILSKKENDDSLIKSPISSRLHTLNKEFNGRSSNRLSSAKRVVSFNKNTPINLNKRKNNNISVNTEDFSVTSETSNASLLFSKRNNGNGLRMSTKRSVEKSNGKSSNKKNIGLIGRMKKKLDQGDRTNLFKKKSGLKKDGKMSRKSSRKRLNSNNANKNDVSISSKNSMDLNLATDKITKLETHLQNEENLINNDPLLVSNLKEIEIAHLSNINKDLLYDSRRRSLKNEFLYQIYKNTIFNEHLNNILIFLSNKDILEFKNCSKVLHKSVIQYLIKQLDIERNNFISKQNELNLSLEEIQQKPSLNDYKFTKGAYRAISLLNEGMLNGLFKNEGNPNKEIFIIYKIFFLLINHPEISKYDIDCDEIFWEKCKKYFLDYNGNIGDLLNDIINNKKVVLSGDNIYKIYKIVKKDIDKIVPAYFSKICTTTGLFVFFIKDILDFLGFSTDRKIQKNSYWSYSEIINLIDTKINTLNKSQIH